MFLLAKITNYAEFVKLCASCPIMRKIMCAHNRIIPLSLHSSYCLYDKTVIGW